MPRDEIEEFATPSIGRVANGVVASFPYIIQHGIRLVFNVQCLTDVPYRILLNEEHLEDAIEGKVALSVVQTFTGFGLLNGSQIGFDRELGIGRSARLALIISELPHPRPEQGDGGSLRRCVMCRGNGSRAVDPRSVPL